MMLRVHWSDAGNFGDMQDVLGCLTYSDDALQSKLGVTMNYLFNPKKTDQYPAIILGFGGMQAVKNTLDNFAGNSEDYGENYYAMPAKTTMTVAHIHRDPDTASAMAESTATFLMGTREPTMDRLKLRAYDIAGISNIKPLEKMPSQFFNVEVLAQLDFNMAMTVNLEGHRLKKFGQELNSEHV